MNPTSPRRMAALEAAAHRLKLSVRDAARACVDSLGMSALSTARLRDRDDLMAAQFDLSRKVNVFALAFNDEIDRRLARETAPQTAGRRPLATTQWESLTLVSDHEVEAQVSADRFGMAIQHACEWELRELDAYIGSLLELSSPDHERNPLRPEVVGKALVSAVDQVSERPELRKLLATELSRRLVTTMPKVYADIVADMRAAGITPVRLSVRGVEGPGNVLGYNTSGYDSRLHGLDGAAAVAAAATAYGQDTGLQGGYLQEQVHLASEPMRQSGHGREMPSDAALRAGAARHSDEGSLPSSLHGGFGGTRPGGSFGHVDAQLMSLIRRLTFVATSSSGGSGDYLSSAPSTGLGSERMPPNIIQAHRSELRQASSGALDHMVIDVVGGLFEQILSDPKVPPGMARQLARLQLPVLRVALGDVTFFSSRRHPVRRFVNRIASLACAFDDLNEGAGKEFLGLVRALVQDIVDGDFDQMEVYEQQLAALEGFVARQAESEVKQHAEGAAALLENKEQVALLHQRYMLQLKSALAPVGGMHDFILEFLSQVWSQALLAAAGRNDGGALFARYKGAARDLVMSVQPKSSPADRQRFLRLLPQLMKDLNDGMALVGWPETARKRFFAQLLPAHAESLKGQSLSHLDYNLLAKELDSILGAPAPRPEDLPPAVASIPVLHDAVDEARFSADEARRIGLVEEAKVDWNGVVDIDLSAEPELTAVDIHIDGLPPADAAEPTRGASLADNVQLGFAYQMHLDGQWQKVKLSYVSPGRAFFIFTGGKQHQRTVSMTARMLKRLCDTQRMRAFENAYLLERATARARKQLADLGVATRH